MKQKLINSLRFIVKLRFIEEPYELHAPFDFSSAVSICPAEIILKLRYRK